MDATKQCNSGRWQSLARLLVAVARCRFVRAVCCEVARCAVVRCGTLRDCSLRDCLLKECSLRGCSLPDCLLRERSSQGSLVAGIARYGDRALQDYSWWLLLAAGVVMLLAIVARAPDDPPHVSAELVFPFFFRGGTGSGFSSSCLGGPGFAQAPKAWHGRWPGFAQALKSLTWQVSPLRS